MRRVYLHIGFGKTGSSSLQSYLTYNPEFQHPETNEKFLYCCILENGQIIVGDELKRNAEKNPLKYMASASDIANVEIFNVLKVELDRIFENGYSPIFSQEDWWRKVLKFRDSNFFNQLDIVADVIVYVRPQVDWFNSAWWQWFAWEKSFKKPQDVIDAWGINFMQWGNHITQWVGIGGVNNVIVRLQPTDIVEDFLGLFKIAPGLGLSQKYRVNMSIAPLLIKFLLKFRLLRKPHNARIAIPLSRYLKYGGESLWVVTPELSHQIMVANRSDNERLLEMLDESSQVKMKNDPRWWCASHYKSRKVANEKDLELSWKELYLIISQGIRAILNQGKS